MTKRAPRISALLATAASVCLFAGCSGSVEVGSKTLDKDEVAATVKKQLTEQVGQEPDDVTCPEDLEAKVGAELTCTLTAGTDSLDVSVKVTSVKDGTAKFDIEVLDPAAQ